MRTKKIIGALMLFGSMVAAHAANAQLFRGKNLTILLGAQNGGALDLQVRLIARHLGQHIPGNPSVVVSSLPGGAGVAVARNLFNIAPKDGSTIGLTQTSALIQPMLKGEADANYDVTKFNYLGSSFSDVPICIANKSASITSLPDILRKELVVGALSPGATGGDFPTIIAGLLGAKFHLVRGYRGFQGAALALDGGEVQVICMSWAPIKARYPDILRGTTDLRVFGRGDFGDESELAKAGIPSFATLATNEFDRRALEFYMSQFVIASPFILPPNVPSHMVQVLRDALAQTMADPALQADAATERLDISFTSGERVQHILAQMYQTPVEIRDRVKKVLAAQ